VLVVCRTNEEKSVEEADFLFVLFASRAFAQNAAVTEPVCEPIGRTSKGDLVFSMECRNIPGLPPGDKPVGYNPSAKETLAPQPTAPKVPESKKAKPSGPVSSNSQ
jgi:hypothetical protein